MQNTGPQLNAIAGLLLQLLLSPLDNAESLLIATGTSSTTLNLAYTGLLSPDVTVHTWVSLSLSPLAVEL